MQSSKSCQRRNRKCRKLARQRRHHRQRPDLEGIDHGLFAKCPNLCNLVAQYVVHFDTLVHLFTVGRNRRTTVQWVQWFIRAHTRKNDREALPTPQVHPISLHHEYLEQEFPARLLYFCTRNDYCLALSLNAFFQQELGLKYPLLLNKYRVSCAAKALPEFRGERQFFAIQVGAQVEQKATAIYDDYDDDEDDDDVWSDVSYWDA